MSLHAEALSMDVREQVLRRLGLADHPAPTVDDRLWVFVSADHPQALSN
jgi:hypothetical protein